ncbi:hypothetical protein BJ978_003104 [Agromyces terreus]|uniref:Alpha/beta hydrolase n=1 Tax=Agromyces terreus TaxID=424795 RepID=A0A9X2KCH3_9MICO|nr:alpha/beta hydrolase [Agromyces terreus]MCP2372428.1 hypothetical protein [Agromyces terreus]
MTTHLIVPGIYDSGPRHWQTHWERQLERAVRIAPSSWDEPRLVDWIAAIDRASAEAGPEAVVVAHSMGCIAFAEWLLRNPGRASAVLFVAPADPEGDRYPEAAHEFAGIGAGELGVPALVVGSENDPFGTREFSAALARTWGAAFVSAGALGHINADSGLGAWPEGRDLLDGLVAGARAAA